ncbi:MAG: hypothetical protein GYA55_13025 [SAR324 cluster bacterium]|uniref:Glycosyltransferase 2-like domain-containing protein n=1 Tax=SAR324 cluster bacterium TaxID=2024889 RepID=A0A7X9ILE5_9DELT|nr:hypothetical protein [SAR324 cluster bacterium]
MKTNSEEKVKVSIIICQTAKKWESILLEEILDSLTRQEPRELCLEVIVVSSRACININQEHNFKSLKMVKCSRGTPAWKRKNLGAHESKGDFLLFVNRGVRFSPDYLKNLIQHLELVSVVAVQGRGLERGDTDITSYPRVAGFKRIFRVPYLDDTGVLIRRSIFNALGGFGPFHAGFDWIDLSWRILFSDCLIAYETKAVFYELESEQVIQDSFRKGWEMAAFIIRWKEVLFVSLRLKRIAFRTNERLRRCLHCFFDMRNLIELKDLTQFIVVCFLRVSGFIFGIPSALLLKRGKKHVLEVDRTLSWVEKDNARIQGKRVPTTFFYLNGEFLFAGRISVISHSGFIGAEREFLISWLNGQCEPGILRKNYTDQPSQISLTEKDLLRSMAKKMIQEGILEKSKAYL